MGKLNLTALGGAAVIMFLLTLYVGSYLFLGRRNAVPRSGIIVFPSRRQADFFEPAANVERLLTGRNVFPGWISDGRPEK